MSSRANGLYFIQPLSTSCVHPNLSALRFLFMSCSLSNYRILQESTTHWCPEREEHGYYLSPLFKCATNSRVSAAHNWTKADVVGPLSKPTGQCALRARDEYMAHGQQSASTSAEENGIMRARTLLYAWQT